MSRQCQTLDQWHLGLGATTTSCPRQLSHSYLGIYLADDNGHTVSQDTGRHIGAAGAKTDIEYKILLILACFWTRILLAP